MTAPAEELPDTPLTLALRDLVAAVELEGVHAVAARLERDPSALPGLARHVHEASRNTMLAIWEDALAPRSDAYGRYEPLMYKLGLLWAAYLPPRVLGSTVDPEPHDHFRIGSDVREHPSGVKLPVLLSPIFDWEGHITGLVTIYLKPDWSDLTDLHPKTTILGDLPGNVVVLRRREYATMVAIDLAAAARAFGRVEWPVVLTLTAENLADRFMPPPDVRRLMIYYDDDTFAPALTAARRIKLADRWLGVSLLGPRGRPRDLEDVEEDLQHEVEEADAAL